MPNVPSNRKRQSLTRLLLGILPSLTNQSEFMLELDTGEISSGSNLYSLQQPTLSFLSYSQLEAQDVHMYIMFQFHLSERSRAL